MEYCASCSTGFGSRGMLSIHMLLSHGLILAEPVVSVTALPEGNLSQGKNINGKSSNHSYEERPGCAASVNENTPPAMQNRNVFNVFKVFSRSPEGGATRLRYGSLQLLACNDFGVISATEKSLEKPKLSFYSQSETFFNTPYQVAGSNVVAGQETVSDHTDIKTTETVVATKPKDEKNSADVKDVVKDAEELKTVKVDRMECINAGPPKEVRADAVNETSQDHVGVEDKVATLSSTKIGYMDDMVENDISVEEEFELDDDGSNFTLAGNETDTADADEDEGVIEKGFANEISSTETALCPLCEQEFELSSLFTPNAKNHFSRMHPGYKENTAFINFCKFCEITVCPIAGCHVFRNTKDGTALMITHMKSHENTKNAGTVIKKKEERKLEVAQVKKSKSCCPFDNCRQKDLTVTNMRAHFKKYHPNRKVSKTFLKSHGFYSCPELDCTKFFTASESNISNIVTHYRNDHPVRDSEVATSGCKRLARKLERRAILKEELRKKKHATKTNDKVPTVSKEIKKKCPAEGCSFKGKGSRSFLMHLRDVHASEYFSSFTLREYGLKKCDKPDCKVLFMRSHNFESVYNTHLMNCHNQEQNPEENPPPSLEPIFEPFIKPKGFADIAEQFARANKSLQARQTGENYLNSIQKQPVESKSAEKQPDYNNEDALEDENKEQPCPCPLQGCHFVGKNLYGTRLHFPRAHKNHSLSSEFIQKYNLICCPESGCSSNFTPSKNFRLLLLAHYSEKHNDVSMDNLNHHFVTVWKNVYGGPTKRKTSTAKQEPEQTRMDAPKQAESTAMPSATPSPTPNYKVNAAKGQFVDVSKSNINLRCVAAGCKESFSGCSIAVCLQILWRHFKLLHSGLKAPERLISGLNNTDSVILCPYNGCGEFRAGGNAAQDIHLHLSEHNQDGAFVKEEQTKVEEREIRVEKLPTTDGRSVFRTQCLESGCNVRINALTTDSCIKKLQDHYEINHLVDFPKSYKLVTIPLDGNNNSSPSAPATEAKEATKRKSGSDTERKAAILKLKLTDLGKHPKMQKVETSKTSPERANGQHEQAKQGSPIPTAPSSPFTPTFKKKDPASTDTIPNLIRSSSTTPPRPQPRVIKDNVINLVDD